MSEQTRYRVVKGYATVRTGWLGGFLAATGRRGTSGVVGIYRGGLIPEDASSVDIERLLRKGYIEPVEVSA